MRYIYHRRQDMVNYLIFFIAEKVQLTCTHPCGVEVDVTFARRRRLLVWPLDDGVATRVESQN
jgi:hypothetical protein